MSLANIQTFAELDKIGRENRFLIKEMADCQYLKIKEIDTNQLIGQSIGAPINLKF